jgi:two-component system, OmpR family, KDP operon response regulator KdpE
LTDPPTALVIADERQIRRLLRLLLENEYRVFESENGRQGLVEIITRRPDVVLLDLGLPDLNGLEVLKRLREWSRVPVLILSVREGTDEKVAALDNGADDYVTKPFESAELLARLRAIQRRAPSGADQPCSHAGHLEIDFNGRSVRVNDKEVKLTTTEYALLKVLARYASKVVTHKQLLREVWGPNAEEQSQYLRVYVVHLRKKIEIANAPSKLIRTESGIVYRLVIPSPGR